MTNVKKLDDYPKEFSDSFKDQINKTKELFKSYEEYINKPMVKCCVVGNTSSGKSTLINALLGKFILYEGHDEGTLCAAICQSSSNNEEYFKICRGTNSLNEHMPIEKILNINQTNKDYSKLLMDLNNYLDIYLKVSNHAILDKFILIDCPGFNDDNLNAISKYCKSADIIIFCFRANAGVTDRDIEKIEQMKSNIGNFQTSFIINYFSINEFVDKNRIIYRLTPLLSGEDAIYFISALEEKERMMKAAKGILNDPRHGEFELFKQCLQKQKSLAAITYNKIYLDLISSVNELLNCLDYKNSQYNGFSDKIFQNIQQEIIQLINKDEIIYYKTDTNVALMQYSDDANNVISKHMMEQFIIDYKLNDGIIEKDYFYKRFIRNDSIPKPLFNWYNFGIKSEEMKTCFEDYFSNNSSNIHKEVMEHYSKETKTCLNHLRIYKEELESITNHINKLAMI